MPINFSSGRKPLSVFSAAGLTDIVLLLLIFFLLTSTFVAQPGIQVTLPRAETGTPDEPSYVTVTITAAGQFFVGEQETTEAALSAVLEAARGEREALLLRADEQATVGQFAAVASVARQQGLRVLMATELPD
jgi:biopolymer transport protein ExbD